MVWRNLDGKALTPALLLCPPGLCASHCAIFYVYIGATAKDQQRRARGGGGAGDEDDLASSGGVLTFFVPAVKLDGDA